MDLTNQQREGDLKLAVLNLNVLAGDPIAHVAISMREVSPWQAVWNIRLRLNGTNDLFEYRDPIAAMEGVRMLASALRLSGVVS